MYRFTVRTTTKKRDKKPLDHISLLLRAVQLFAYLDASLMFLFYFCTSGEEKMPNMNKK